MKAVEEMYLDTFKWEEDKIASEAMQTNRGQSLSFCILSPT